MKGIKNYFKPDSEIVAKENNIETNIIATETKKENEIRRDHISMKGIKNYFKPDSEIVAKENNIETNIIATETTTKQSQCSIVKGISLVSENPCQPSNSFTFPKRAFAKQNHSCQS